MDLEANPTTPSDQPSVHQAGAALPKLSVLGNAVPLQWLSQLPFWPFMVIPLISDPMGVDFAAFARKINPTRLFQGS